MPDYTKFNDYKTKNIESLSEIKKYKRPVREELDTTQDLPDLEYEREQEREMRRQNRNNRRPAPKKNNSKQKFAIFYIGLLFVAVVVCIVVFVFAFRWAMESTPDIIIPDTPDIIAGDENGHIAANREIENMVALVTSISTDPRGLTLLNIETETTRHMPFDGDVILRNRAGNPMAFTQLRVGQLMEIQYDTDSLEVTAVRESQHAWEHRAQTGVHVNTDNRTISIPHEQPFSFTSQTLFLHDGEPFSVGQIGPMDAVTIIGIGTTAWLIQLDASHGFLEITNFAEIVDGTITIGTLHPLPLNEIVEPITLSDGTHRIIVEGANIETFIENIVIAQGQTLTFSLEDVQPRMSSLHIVTSPTGATIFVNGEEAQSPITIGFGEHIIRVEREGYEPQERVVTVSDRVMSERFELEAIHRVPDPHQALLDIRTIPTQAHIYINGVFAGTSNLAIPVPPGVHTITARLPGHQDSTIQRTVAAGEEADLLIVLIAETP